MHHTTTHLPIPLPILVCTRLCISLSILFPSLFLSLSSISPPPSLQVWFLKEVGLDPARTNAVLAVTPLVTAAAAFACQRCSRVLGRVQTCLVFRSTGVALLLWMGLQPSIWRRPWVALVFMARTALTNCGYPVRRSILMDFVPKSRSVLC